MKEIAMTRLQLVLLSLLAALAGTGRRARRRLEGAGGRPSGQGERGSLTTEQAVITGILVVAAVGLGVLITAVVTKYGSKIQ